MDYLLRYNKMKPELSPEARKLIEDLLKEQKMMEGERELLPPEPWEVTPIKFV